MDGYIHAATDVTGYGLLGHAHEMMEASGRPFTAVDPLLSQAGSGFAGHRARRSRVNVRNMRPRTEIGADVTDDDFLLLCDAQTSGGLLVALPEEEAEIFAARCRERGASSTAVIGRVREKGRTLLRVTK
jgi:selenide,water dikinase